VLGPALASSGVASAQSDARPVAKERAAKETAADETAGRPVAATPAEQLAKAKTYIATMEASREKVARMLDEARLQRDVVKTLCLNDKLNQLDVAIRSAGERKGALESAVGQRDADLANHEFIILRVVFDRSVQVVSEADQCIGREAKLIGESSTTMEIDPGMTQDDPSEYPMQYGAIALPPGSSSAFK
jgi:hypothetical protein